MSMTRADLQRIHEVTCGRARETQEKKNHDYASEADIFRNFRYFGGLGILVRMSDKLARLRSFEENGVFKVEDERLADTIQDLINYAVIYYAFKQEGKQTPPKVTVMPGPFCEQCGKLAEFRLDRNLGPVDTVYFFCGHCAEKQPMADVQLMTAMGKL